MCACRWGWPVFRACNRRRASRGPWYPKKNSKKTNKKRVERTTEQEEDGRGPLGRSSAFFLFFFFYLVSILVTTGEGACDTKRSGVMGGVGKIAPRAWHRWSWLDRHDRGRGCSLGAPNRAPSRQNQRSRPTVAGRPCQSLAARRPGAASVRDPKGVGSWRQRGCTRWPSVGGRAGRCALVSPERLCFFPWRADDKKKGGPRRPTWQKARQRLFLAVRLSEDNGRGSAGPLALHDKRRSPATGEEKRTDKKTPAMNCVVLLFLSPVMSSPNQGKKDGVNGPLNGGRATASFFESRAIVAAVCAVAVEIERHRTGKKEERRDGGAAKREPAGPC